jgi:hypothetical protein
MKTPVRGNAGQGFFVPVWQGIANRARRFALPTPEQQLLKLFSPD